MCMWWILCASVWAILCLCVGGVDSESEKKKVLEIEGGIEWDQVYLTQSHAKWLYWSQIFIKRVLLNWERRKRKVIFSGFLHMLKFKSHFLFSRRNLLWYKICAVDLLTMWNLSVRSFLLMTDVKVQWETTVYSWLLNQPLMGLYPFSIERYKKYTN